jgi:type III pantothenate kinase
MILTIDLGNSEISFGKFVDGQLMSVFRTAANRTKSVDEYISTFTELFSLKKVENIENIIVSSVVPQLVDNVLLALKHFSKINPLMIEPGIKTGLKLKMDNANEIGADLIADAVGAIKRYGYPILILDLGTANKLIAIDKDGYFRGGIINPGIRISLEALINVASQLPNIKLVRPSKVIGANTLDAMNSGIVYGYAHMFDGLIKQFSDELGYNTKVVITGGLSSYIKPAMKTDELILDQDLIHYGLMEIYLKNIKENK